MILTTDTYQNHLDNEYRQRTEAFAQQQRLAQSVRGTGSTLSGIPAFVQRYRKLPGVLLFMVIALVSIRTSMAHDSALTADETRVVLTAVSADAAFNRVILADAAYQPEAVRNAWTNLKQRREWEKGRKRTLISYD